MHPALQAFVPSRKQRIVRGYRAASSWVTDHAPSLALQCENPVLAPPEPTAAPAAGSTQLETQLVVEEVQVHSAYEEASRNAIENSWDKLTVLQRQGELQDVTVLQTIKAGCLVRVEGLRGFVPFGLLSQALAPSLEHRARAAAGEFGDEPFPNLVGQTLTVRVMEVIKSKRRVVCSCTAAERDILAGVLVAGQELGGQVRSIHAFGAFVEVDAPSGHRGQVFVPTSEISWDWVSDVHDYLTIGQQLVASLRALQQDPLKVILDRAMPLHDDRNSYVRFCRVATRAEGMQPLLGALREEEGLLAVELGRQVSDLETEAKDLEVWMTRRPVAGGFNLVVMAGRELQEIKVTTFLHVDAMRAAVQHVLAKLG